MGKPLRVLIAEDVEQDALLVVRELTRGGFDVTFERVDTPEAMSAALARQPWDIVISDYSMPPRFSALLALGVMNELKLDLPFIIVSATIGEETAVEAIRAGAHDFMVKGKFARFVPAVERELREAEARRKLRRSEHDLRASEARLWNAEAGYRVLFEQSPNGIVLIDAETGTTIEANETAYQQLGYTREEFAALRITDYEAGETLEETRAHIQKVRSDGSDDFETLQRTKNGEIRNVHVWVKTVLLGERTAFYCIFQDITERRQAENAQRESETSLRESQTIAGLGSYVMDISTGRWKGSDVLDRILGIDDRYVRSVEGWLALVHPEWRTPMSAYLTNDVVGKGIRFDKEYKIVRKNDNQERWLHGIGNLEFDDQGQPVRMRGTIQDITERLRLQAQLFQAQKMESVGRLAGGVAHDFNNLLSVIIGWTEVAISELPAGHATREPLEEVLRAGHRAAEVTHQLLAFARQQVVQPTLFNANDLVVEIDKMLRRLVGEDIELVTRTDPDLGTVKMDRGQLEQVLMNLVINARDAMPEGGTLTIATANVALDAAHPRKAPDVPPGEYVMLSVSDSGTGMNEEVKAHSFEPFFTTKPPGKGTGLGLATCHGIVKQAGGHIAVHSEMGVGTTMKLYLPRRHESAAAVARGPKGTSVRGVETILLVEDEEAVRRVTTRMLEAHGYRVVSTSGGEEALQVIEEGREPVQLLLTDVVLAGGMNGRDLADSVRALKPNLKVLFASGYTSDVAILHDLVEQRAVLLEKPFTAESLGSKVREVLDAE